MDEHRFIVTVGGCTSDQAHEVMRERLGFDESYGFDYTLDWDEQAVATASDILAQAKGTAMGVEGVKSASFSQRNTGISGVVYHAPTDIEFDVRHSADGPPSHTWNVNDDRGRDFASSSLLTALTSAIRANGGTGVST